MSFVDFQLFFPLPAVPPADSLPCFLLLLLLLLSLVDGLLFLFGFVLFVCTLVDSVHLAATRTTFLCFHNSTQHTGTGRSCLTGTTRPHAFSLCASVRPSASRRRVWLAWLQPACRRRQCRGSAAGRDALKPSNPRRASSVPETSNRTRPRGRGALVVLGLSAPGWAGLGRAAKAQTSAAHPALHRARHDHLLAAWRSRRFPCARVPVRQTVLR